jgi:glycosyltransferase involved in cell wall biosynthesis
MMQRIDVVIPVYNEAHVLEASVRTLHAFLAAHVPQPCTVVIADNASTDGTLACARELAADLPGLRVLRLEEKGRGRALRTAWLASDADVLSYMDVDLSTDLAAFPRLVSPIVEGRADMAIGSRLMPGARVRRQLRRELLSRGYNLTVRGLVGTAITDAQCGFKAISAGLAHRLLPRVVDHGWFFDTELLLLAEHTGERIVQVPVDWVEDTDSRVDILATVMADLRGLQRVRRSFRTAGAAPAAAAHDDPDLRGGRRGGTEWAVGEVLSCSPAEPRVTAGRPAPRRGPNGLGA